jgi:hypothetical protein
MKAIAHQLCLGLQTYWYWRGVAEALDSETALASLLDETPAISEDVRADA